MSGPVTIDGAMGEGGGQIVRTSLALSAVTGRALTIENIRARRANPGLAAQHLTAVRAAGAICAAEIEGDALGAKYLRFSPRRPPAAGDYVFDVGEARPGGSAGSVTLLAQTILLPLALAHGRSQVLLRGGTHVPWSPSFDYLRDVWLFALGRLGVAAGAELAAFGFYPAGRGEIKLDIAGLGQPGTPKLRPFSATARGEVLRVFGHAVAANLPAHIAQRMADRARTLLSAAGIEGAVAALRVSAACPGAGIFLTLESERVRAGESERVRAGESEHARAGESERVRAGESGRVRAGESERVRAGESERVRAGESEHVRAGESERARAGESERVRAGESERVRAGESECVRAGESERVRAGFSSLGRPGKPAETVAEEAVAELLAYRESEGALDRHLADQIILPAALAGGASEFTAQEVTGHLVTCAAVVERFDLARVEIAGEPGATGRVKVAPGTAP